MTSIAHSDPCVNRCEEPRSVPINQAAGKLLADANARLLARRAQHVSRPRLDTRDVPSTENLPPHLNWGSAAIPIKQESSRSHPQSLLSVHIENAGLNALRPSPMQDAEHPIGHSDGDRRDEKWTIVQPSLLVGMLKQEVVAIGRIYLLCRHLDTNGRGWLSIADLRAQLTDKTSPLHVCGWRRLRQILQAGKGQFWERDDHERLWLYGLTRVAAQLGVQQFSGDTVEMSLETLCSEIGNVRGAFYTAFHAGRDCSPIARATLRDITGVAERTQRTYDDQQDVARTSNYTLLHTSDAPETYFVHGRAAFPFKDKNGRHGQIGRSYLAVRLPNSYQTRLTRLPTKQKRLNKRLRQDLVKYGTRGNSSSSNERIYFTEGRQIARKINQTKGVRYLHHRQDGSVAFWIEWGRK